MEAALKSLPVHLDGTARAKVRLGPALQLAARCHARVSALFALAPCYLAVLPLVPGVPSMPSRAPVDSDHRLLAVNAFEEARLANGQPCEWLELRGETLIET